MKWLLAIVLLLGLGAAVYFGAREARQVVEAHKPPAPEVRVPADWQALRSGHMHQVHVAVQDLACTECHDESGFESPSMTRCVGCHEHEAQITHARVGDAEPPPDTVGASCLACHHFDAQEAPSAWRCLDCHAQAQGDLPATSVHAEQDCGRCHQPHETPPVEASGCADCHELSPQATAHEDCLTCHTAHGAAEGAQTTCRGCHAQPESATFAGGHERCSTCHAPHRFGASEAVACASCHKASHALAATRVDAHRRCESCHDPHRPGKAGDEACRSCHASRSPHPPPYPGQTCTGCHPAHPKQTTPMAVNARPCASCHRAVVASVAGGAVHGGGAQCTDCHKPHGEVSPQQATTCESCHEAQLGNMQPVATGHQRCGACHREHPHALGPQSRAAACTTCHVQLTSPKGHKRCGTCHAAHGFRASENNCQACHSPIARSARPGHKACLSCHAPHTEAAIPSCLNCHQAMSQRFHAQSCTGCHDVHGTGKPLSTLQPNCATCHKPPLPGLHGVLEHGNCAACHNRSHDAGARADRATCVACHTAERNHEPSAATCQGCHIFRK